MSSFQIIKKVWALLRPNRDPISTLPEGANSEAQSAYVREVWNHRKHKDQVVASFVIAIIIVGGLDLISPFYGVGDFILQNIIRPSELFSWIDRNKLMFLQVKEEESLDFDLPQIGYILLTFIFSKAISSYWSHKDPYSRKVFIREAHDEDSFKHLSPPFTFASTELRYYAAVCPSNRLVEMCDRCSAEDCPNRLALGKGETQTSWESMIPHIPATLLSKQLSDLHDLRKLALRRYGLCLIAVSGTLFYFLARLVEALRSDVDVNPQYEILLCTLAVWLLLWFNNHIGGLQSGEPQGPLAKFKDSTNAIIESQEYEGIHMAVICDFEITDNVYQPMAAGKLSWEVYAGREYGIQVTKSEWIDRMLERKFVLSTDPSHSALTSIEKCERAMRNLLSALLELYLELHDGSSFRVVMYLPKVTENYLKPVLDLPTREDAFVTLSDENICKANFRIDGGPSVVSECWESGESVSKSGSEINYFDRNQEIRLKSLMACPITVPQMIHNQLQEIGHPIVNDGEEMGEVIGVLCIDSNSENVFNVNNSSINKDILDPFIRRLAYEMSILTSTDDDDTVEGLSNNI